MTDLMVTPVYIADTVFKAALKEQIEVIEENERRAKIFKDPLPLPPWDVKRMVQNIKDLTARTFTPHFRELDKLYPYDGSSDPDEWAEMAIKRLRDDYLIKIAREDDDLLKQLCEIWPELTPPPALTEQQKEELTNLQKKADAIMEKVTSFLKDCVDEMKELAKHEDEIVKNTKVPGDKRIDKLVQLLEIIIPDRYINIFNFPRW